MGDNRYNSADSRYNQDQPTKGFVPISNVVGRALLITWPIDRWAWLDNYPSVFRDAGQQDDALAREPETVAEVSRGISGERAVTAPKPVTLVDPLRSGRPPPRRPRSVASARCWTPARSSSSAATRSAAVPSPARSRVGVCIVDIRRSAFPRGLRDSKLLSEKAAREHWRRPCGPGRSASAVGLSSNDEIDRLGLIIALGLGRRRAPSSACSSRASSSAAPRSSSTATTTG